MQEESVSLPPKEEFSEWYNDILWRAEVMDVRYPVKGLYVWYPHGFAIRRAVYQILRSLLDRDHQETLFPLLIPATEFMKEAEHIKGFENEVFWVTKGGQNELEVPLALRPTSETAIYPMYALWIRSHADLPIRLYQVVNTFRYETKHTRPLIRLREITSFKEAHTVHRTWEEAEKQVNAAIDLYREFYRKLCVPVIVSKRPEWDKFPGADYTIAIDTVMPDGKTLQIGTVHHLGDHFSMTFGIMFEDEKGEQKYAQQTCYGISERCIAALIAIHGDDRGLVLPHEVAPVQVLIVPVIIGKRREEIMTYANGIRADVEAMGLRVRIDDREIRPGAKYYHWEMRGVPLRLEVGPRDLDGRKVMAVARDGKRSLLNREEIRERVVELLREFNERISESAEGRLRSCIKRISDLGEIGSALEKGVVIVGWCGNYSCAQELEKKTGASVLGSCLDAEMSGEGNCTCIVCGTAGAHALVGRAY
ncbi:MAG: proline--tRNA ligase [Methanomicrobiales archaeon]|nr:proline--tRNA ligase [Methanomicrobiales archaeon]